jgi:hypothetical protein
MAALVKGDGIIGSQAGAGKLQVPVGSKLANIAPHSIFYNKKSADNNEFAKVAPISSPNLTAIKLPC